MSIKWLDSPEKNHLDMAVYSLDYCRKNFLVSDLTNRGYLVIKHSDDPDSDWMHFAVLSFDSSSGIDGSNTMLTAVFHGDGPSGVLRECRHTYWGEDGYIFYPDGPLIASALTALSRYYDGLVS